MAVHLFEVKPLGRNAPPLAELLQRIEAAPLPDRLKKVGQQDIRLEALAAPNSAGNRSPYWLLDFTKIRYENGPGKASRDLPIEGFELDVDQGFGEETSALFDEARNVILIQYNHHGVRSGIVKNYFSLCAHDQDQVGSYEFNIRMDDQADVRFAQKQIITKLHFKIAPPRMSNAQRGGNVSLQRSIELSDNLNAASIEVVISAARDTNASLSFRNATAFARKLMGMRADAGDPEPVITKLEVAGRDGAAEPLDVVDLLKPKLEQRIGDLQLGNDRRYTRESRWTALLRARNGWARILER
ncbi:DUF6731 family protein [Robbsia andropogonis]|uniref:DUF6731 family protein n=1 Tax=Robbsia andropogonis TaxID=28092 RepID=UPI00209CF4F7|nr:DUF6731 family protein [Robbsia andropogonis]MCP1119067.1 hypothetical protein [Robbsia andropogonis]MCP1128581.1 hypothetical protein [Robbsia andropogonis]